MGTGVGVGDGVGVGVSVGVGVGSAGVSVGEGEAVSCGEGVSEPPVAAAGVSAGAAVGSGVCAGAVVAGGGVCVGFVTRIPSQPANGRVERRRMAIIAMVVLDFFIWVPGVFVYGIITYFITR